MTSHSPLSPFSPAGRSLALGLLFLVLLGLLLPLPLFASQPTPAQSNTTLSYPGRVACQTAVEEVYWQHRLWPEANPGPKPALDEVMPAAAIRAKVDEALAYSLALESVWQQPITGAMLQAEMARIAADSRQPALIRDVYAALDHNPALVAECLARPVLAQRLVQNWFRQDERFAGTDFATWWADARPAVPAFFMAPAYDYELPAVTAPAGGDDTWADTAAIPLDDIYGDLEGASVWTGTEMIFIGDFDVEAFRYNPATDSWQTATTLAGPSSLRDVSAVWTGTEMITWGGCTANNHNCTVGIGFRYDPVTDTWTETDFAPISRTDHSAVWTGSEMIVWGGCTYFNDSCQVFSQQGARYDPTTDSWTLMSTSGAPAGRTFPDLMWTGSEMLVWGGLTTANGGRYDPSTDTWSAMSTTDAPISTLSSAVWTGSEMIAWGGCTGSPMCNTPHDTGARYDPTTDTWTATSTTNAPDARFWHDAVWTGSEMAVFGGYDGSNYLGSGGLYDPASDTWAGMSGTNAPAGRINYEILWTGSQVLVWGGTGIADMRNGARYTPGSDTWTPISGEDPDSLRTYHSAVWTGAEMIVWGGVGDGTANDGLDTGRVYDPATNSWSATTPAGAPRGTWNASAVWTGSEMIVWSGQDGTTVPDTGGRYNPMTDSWTAMAIHQGRTQNATVWTGTEMLVWGGNTQTGRSNTGARYDPTTNSWTDMAAFGTLAPRSFPSGVWTGSEMIVWGGYGSTGEVGTGGRYDPDTDSWSTVSNTNAPQARTLHSAVWTGSEMIVWGGAADLSPFTPLATGARYDPGTDTWTATSTTNTPLPVARHSAVWTGDEMLVWSGTCDDSAQPTCHTDSYEGGRYDPIADTWTATTLDGVPEAREWHSTVWTGNAMIVWGGIGDWSGYRHTGGIYFAATSGNDAPIAHDDTYTTTENVTLNVPAPGVLDNDTDADGDTITATLVSPPTHGLLDLQVDGSFTYTPTLDYAGTDSFTYRAHDGTVPGNVATVAITVEADNTAPTANDDAYETLVDTQLDVPAPGVLGNDGDPDGDDLSAVLVGDAMSGTLTLNGDGSFSYLPDSGFIGIDHFTYVADDEMANSNVATVTLTVTTTPNNDPVAGDDSYQVQQGETLTVTAPGLLENDSDLDDDSLTATLAMTPTHGSVSVNGDGSFVFTPDAAFSGADTFTYTVSDGNGGTDTGTVSITVTPIYTTFLPIILKP